MPLKVIGAGFPRTGTSSLQVALNQLGFGPCYHMREIMAQPERAQFWSDAADGKRVDWDAVFDGYVSTTDAPACHFYKELAAFYPDAKLILSLRDPDSWFASTQETILLPMIMKFHGALGTLDTMNKIGWGDDPKLRDKAYMQARFNRHNEEVRKTIPKERLLVFEAKDGWEPLCAFLGVPIPATPYPRVNSKSDWAAGVASPEARKAVESMSPEEIKQMVQARHRGAQN